MKIHKLEIGLLRGTALFVLAFLMCLFLVPSSGWCQDEAEKALALVRTAYGSLKGLKADFVQTEERPGIGVTVREEGVVSFLPPDRMRWDYGGKRPHLVVINGSRVWIHTPSRHQIVLRTLTPEEMRRGATTLLTGLDGIEEDFTIQSRATAPQESIPLDLFPRANDLPYDKISILVDPESGMIQRISIHHRLGNITTITFSDIKTGVVPDDKLFEWNVPEGTEIIEP